LVVTGAAGFFGLAIVRALTRAEVRVIATDRTDEFVPRPGTEPAFVDYVARDLERENVDDLVDGANGVIYAAALTPGDEIGGETADRLLRVNLAAFLDTLSAARRSRRCSRVMFVSSTGVYDQSRDADLQEDDADGAASLYGAAKLAAELVARRHAAAVGRDFCAIRPTSLFGPGETERPSRPNVTAFARLMRAARERTSVRLEHCDSRADWVAVDDAGEAVALLWRAPSFPELAFNVSSGAPRTLRDVADAVARVTDLRIVDDGEAVVDGGPDRPARISNARLHALGWHPARTPEDVVREMLAETSAASA
jgi:nucleoside-diphosphate-sugar epimerase